MTWRLAGALVALRNAVNQRWPNRDRTSDGTIGDAAHAARSSSSDHNPWIVVDGVGVVRAFDCDVDGIDAGWYAEQLRLAGARGDRRLTGGGYVIFNRRITTANFAGWALYTGSNPHTQHVHVSFSRNQAGFDDGSGWAFLTGKEDDVTPEQLLDYSLEGGTVSTAMNKINVGLPQFQAETKAMLAEILAAAREDLDTETVLSRLDTSVRAATTTAITQTVLPAIQRIEKALAADNTDEAKAFVTELTDRLRKAA